MSWAVLDYIDEDLGRDWTTFGPVRERLANALVIWLMLAREAEERAP